MSREPTSIRCAWRPSPGVLPGQALIAPGNRHMLLKRTGGRYLVELHLENIILRDASGAWPGRATVRVSVGGW